VRKAPNAPREHLRLLREWLQRHAGKLADIPYAHICYIECGIMIPTPDQLKRLGKVFRCPPDRLLDHVAESDLPDGAEHRDAQRCDQDADATGSTGRGHV
jgi:hypothetical protein